MKRTPTVLGLAGAAVVLLGAPALGATKASATHSVSIKDIDFTPKRLVIAKGDTVVWRFQDKVVSHNVTSRGTLRFRSSPTKQAGTYSVRFTKSGTYHYVCTIHLNMVASVVVR